MPPLELTSELIRPTLQEMDSAVSGCYALEYGGQQDGGGRLVVSWVIATSGKVESARIDDSSFESPTFATCILEAARALQFPASQRGTELSKPYLVRAQEQSTTEPEASTTSANL